MSVEISPVENLDRQLDIGGVKEPEETRAVVMYHPGAGAEGSVVMVGVIDRHCEAAVLQA